MAPTCTATRTVSAAEALFASFAAFSQSCLNACAGFNLLCNLDETTPETSLWVVPHSHNWGHLDIPSLVSEHGERLPTALPVLTKPGDIAFSSRNMLHGRPTHDHCWESGLHSSKECQQSSCKQAPSRIPALAARP